MVAPATLHPAKRRRLAAEMPREAAHQALLRPLGGGSTALIVASDEQDFLPAVFADLAAADWRARMDTRRQVRRGTDGVAELSQPIHRRFHLLLAEAVCNAPGYPRVDPAKLVGLGLVLRRWQGPAWLGWMTEGGARRGWLGLGGAEDADPDPEPPGAAVRPRATIALERLLAERRGGRPPTEQVLPLHIAPREVCAARGRTILYSVLPLASAETTEAAEALQFSSLPADEAALVEGHLSVYLKQRPARPMPRAGQQLSRTWQSAGTAQGAEAAQLEALLVFLRQLSVEFGLFEPLPTSAALERELRTISLPMARDAMGQVTRRMDAAEFVTKATPILLAGEANGGGLRMPLEWPEVDAAQAGRLQAMAKASLGARFTQVAPKVPKFDDDRAEFAVRPFVRVEGHADCPPRLVWGGYSERFRIRPWWDGDAPPVRIDLPKLADLKKIKPGVSFAMAPEIANLLKGDMKKLRDGDAQMNTLGIGWICSFSIPIITLCAFIVLSIFLALFDLIFWWLLWIKVCIPYPKKK
jgi:hypothetical protein